MKTEMTAIEFAMRQLFPGPRWDARAARVMRCTSRYVWYVARGHSQLSVRHRDALKRHGLARLSIDREAVTAKVVALLEEEAEQARQAIATLEDIRPRVHASRRVISLVGRPRSRIARLARAAISAL